MNQDKKGNIYKIGVMLGYPLLTLLPSDLEDEKQAKALKLLSETIKLSIEAYAEKYYKPTKPTKKRGLLKKKETGVKKESHKHATSTKKYLSRKSK